MEQPIRFTTCPEGHLHAHRAWVTERTGGVSPYPFHSLNLGTRVGDSRGNVEENEGRVLAALGLGAPARAVLVHGISTRIVDGPGLVEATDALVTRKPELPLALTVADCYPLALVAGPWKALAHCGWRGVASGIVEEVLRVLADLGAEIGTARAWIGPGIGPCCYEVGPEVAAAFRPESLRGASRPPRGRARGDDAVHLDLGGDIARRLEAGGLVGRAIASAQVCTSCHTDRFFSHRAEGPTGRMSAYLL